MRYEKQARLREFRSCQPTRMPWISRSTTGNGQFLTAVEEGRAMQRWVNPDTARYYQADLVEDLFGGWSVVTAWGGLMSHRGQMRIAWVETREQAEKRLEEIDKRRRARGYKRAISFEENLRIFRDRDSTVDPSRNV